MLVVGGRGQRGGDTLLAAANRQKALISIRDWILVKLWPGQYLTILFHYDQQTEHPP